MKALKQRVSPVMIYIPTPDVISCVGGKTVASPLKPTTDGRERSSSGGHELGGAPPTRWTDDLLLNYADLKRSSPHRSDVNITGNRARNVVAFESP
ncbi:hypothetical protein EVAR_46986_1 [Eumeta japonica]|uniref:Uncharacterized protein n=1 Tax=Eumeta variegata TaxID=151549 RepID=A0A4C1X9A1_EUMVA|nr:hypothetical protein EVAR_46986_1 [Eumeta japonica]